MGCHADSVMGHQSPKDLQYALSFTGGAPINSSLSVL